MEGLYFDIPKKTHGLSPELLAINREIEQQIHADLHRRLDEQRRGALVRGHLVLDLIGRLELIHLLHGVHTGLALTLRDDLRRTGWVPHNRIFTPQQVQLIFDTLGEP